MMRGLTTNIMVPTMGPRSMALILPPAVLVHGGTQHLVRGRVSSQH
jgi:hypothetical protein